jgi:hypothetical protein
MRILSRGANADEIVPTGHRVLFVHIPKTAGMSLYTALEGWASPRRSLRFPRGGPADLAAYLGLADSTIDGLRLLSGHFPLDVFRRRPLTGWSPITLLRDPVARVLSTFAFARGNPSHPWHEHVARMQFDEFVHWLLSRPPNTNQQCGFIAPERTADAAFAMLSSEFSLCGTVEDLPLFETALSDLLGAAIRIPFRNRSRFPLDSSLATADTLSRIQQATAQDELLYQRVRAAGVVGRLELIEPTR